MTEREFAEFVDVSERILKERQEFLREKFGIDGFERYDWDQHTARLTFSRDGIPRVVADIVFVGSYSTVTSTWMWSC
jgi:hypothetical protein